MTFMLVAFVTVLSIVLATGTPIERAFFIAAPVAVITALLEGVSARGIDNLTVPLVAVILMIAGTS